MTKLLSLFTAVLITFFPLVVSAETEARSIMEMVDARDDGNNQIADMQMILIDKNNKERKRTIKMFSKDQGRDTLRMQFFLAPADFRDVGFLTYDYYGPEKDDDQWLFLPDLHKTKRIASSDKSSSFMGSDFSYADMTRRVLDEWKYTILKEDQVGGNPVWIIETTPKNSAVEDRYGYKKSIVYVRQDIYMVIRAIHVLTESKKIKYMEIKNLEKIDNIWVATETWMKTTKSKRTLHRTVLKSKNIKFNQPLENSFFTVRQLEKGI